MSRLIALMALAAAGCGPEPAGGGVVDSVQVLLRVPVEGEARLSFAYDLATTASEVESIMAARWSGQGRYDGGLLSVHVLEAADGPLAEPTVLDLPAAPPDAYDRFFVSASWPVPIAPGPGELHLAFTIDGPELEVAGAMELWASTGDPDATLELSVLQD